MLGVLIVAIVVVAGALGAQAAEAFHEDWDHVVTLTPYPGHTPEHHYWERDWAPYNIIGDVYSHSGGNYFRDHFIEAFADVVEDGFLPTLYVHLPNQNGTVANVTLSNSSAYVEAAITNATAPYEAAAALPVRTTTITLLGADSAPPVPAASFVQTLYHAPFNTPADIATAPTGHYAGVSSPKNAVLLPGASTIYLHNAGNSTLNATITGLDGSDHSHSFVGLGTFVLPAGDYDYSITGAGYALSWNGTIRTQ